MKSRITSSDQKILDQLGLTNLSERDKQAMIEMIDLRLERRFLANLLLTLPDEKKKELDEKVEKMDNPTAKEIVDLAVDLHPDAKTVLESSAQEIIKEFKKEGVTPISNADSNADIEKIKAKFPIPPPLPSVSPAEELPIENPPLSPATPSQVSPSEPPPPPPPLPATSPAEPPTSTPPTQSVPANDPPSIPTNDPPVEQKPKEKGKSQTLTDGLWRSETHPTTSVSVKQPSPSSPKDAESATKQPQPAEYYEP